MSDEVLYPAQYGEVLSVADYYQNPNHHVGGPVTGLFAERMEWKQNGPLHITAQPPPSYTQQPLQQPRQRQTSVSQDQHLCYPPATAIDLPPQLESTETKHEPSNSTNASSPTGGAFKVRRKFRRAAQACENCRNLKAKCDEGKPCKICKDRKMECMYRSSVSKLPDNIHEFRDGFVLSEERLETMCHHLKDISGSIANINKRMEDMNDRLRRFEEAQQPNSESGETKKGSMMPVDDKRTVPLFTTPGATYPNPVSLDTSNRFVPVLHERTDELPQPTVSQVPPAGQLPSEAVKHATNSSLVFGWQVNMYPANFNMPFPAEYR